MIIQKTYLEISRQYGSALLHNTLTYEQACALFRALGSKKAQINGFIQYIGPFLSNATLHELNTRLLRYEYKTTYDSFLRNSSLSKYLLVYEAERYGFGVNFLMLLRGDDSRNMLGEIKIPNTITAHFHALLTDNIIKENDLPTFFMFNFLQTAVMHRLESSDIEQEECDQLDMKWIGLQGSIEGQDLQKRIVSDIRSDGDREGQNQNEKKDIALVKQATMQKRLDSLTNLLLTHMNSNETAIEIPVEKLDPTQNIFFVQLSRLEAELAEQKLSWSLGIFTRFPPLIASPADTVSDDTIPNISAPVQGIASENACRRRGNNSDVFEAALIHMANEINKGVSKANSYLNAWSGWVKYSLFGYSLPAKKLIDQLSSYILSAIKAHRLSLQNKKLDDEGKWTALSTAAIHEIQVLVGKILSELRIEGTNETTQVLLNTFNTIEQIASIAHLEMQKQCRGRRNQNQDALPTNLSFTSVVEQDDTEEEGNLTRAEL